MSQSEKSTLWDVLRKLCIAFSIIKHGGRYQKNPWCPKREEVDMDIVEENDIIDIDLGYVIPGPLLYTSSDAGILEDD